MDDSSSHLDSRYSDRLKQFIGAPRKAVWTMALPMMAGMAVQTLYVIVDTAFIGTLGTNALAAATFVGPLFFVMIALTIGLGTAVTALIAQAVGRKEPQGADRIAGAALTIGVSLGLLLSTLGLIFGKSILVLFGAQGDTAELSWQYFQIIVFLMPLFFISTVLRSVLNGEGDAKTPTAVLVVSTVINLSLDALFIFVIGLGIRGAALATAGAQMFSFVVFWVLVFRRKTAFVRFRTASFVPSTKVVWQLIKLAVPTSAGMLVMSLGSMGLNRVLSEFGETTIAAYGAASKIDMILGMPIFGLAGAAVSIVGIFAGAQRVDLIRSTAFYTYRWALTLAICIGITAFYASDEVLVIFTRDPKALTIGRGYLGYMIFAYPMMAFGMTTGKLLQGLGYGVPSLIITSVRILLIALPLAYIAVYLFDASFEAVWISLLIGGSTSTVISFFWVRHVIWKKDPTEKAGKTRLSSLPIDTRSDEQSTFQRQA